MDREAIEEAIEVLEDANADMLMETGDKNYYVEAITALRQALEKEWVGLTDEEIQEVVSKKWWDWEDAFDIEGFSRAIEEKLKEKNHG
jgi:hypothetical protein